MGRKRCVEWKGKLWGGLHVEVKGGVGSLSGQGRWGGGGEGSVKASHLIPTL